MGSQTITPGKSAWSAPNGTLPPRIEAKPIAARVKLVPQTMPKPGELLESRIATTAGEALGRIQELSHITTGSPDSPITFEVTEGAKKRGMRAEVELRGENGETVILRGPGELWRAADALTTVVNAGLGNVKALDVPAITEKRTDAIQRLVNESWNAFVCRTDSAQSAVAAAKGGSMLADDGVLYLYVPESDKTAFEKLSREAEEYNRTKRDGDRPLSVQLLGRGRDKEVLDLLEGQKPGLLYLPHPYIVPGGRFKEMYGWDSYFIAQGCMESGRTDLARHLLENQIYMIEHYGVIPNSSRSYHLSRSQPPLMPRLALELHERVPDMELLRHVARAAEKELEGVWYPHENSQPDDFATYYDLQTGPDVEVMRSLGTFQWPDPAADRAERASGWDLTQRFDGRCHEFAPVDLNSYLYRYRKDLAEIYRNLGDFEAADSHDGIADRLKKKLQSHFWDEERGMFFDHDLANNKRSTYESAATFAPLWAGWATPEQAERVANNMYRMLEPGGLAASSKESREAAPDEPLQWDYPNGWPPVQVMALEGLLRYGQDEAAWALGYRWTNALLSIFDRQNGCIPEKIDVHAISSITKTSEYPNQGYDRGDYRVPRGVRPVGFGWSNASVLRMLAIMPEELRTQLDHEVHPDQAVPWRHGENSEGRSAADWLDGVSAAKPSRDDFELAS